jgi:putative aldouronate transport system substrate-binding protein
MYMRQDWADKVGIAQPTNAEEFYNLMVAFTKNDPDGNGQADTYGLGAYAPNTDWNMAFFNNIFGGANNWRRNADGTLTKDWETEEYKEALAFARRLYEAGVYHPDAATMTNQQAKDNLAAGKFGAYADGLAALPGPNGLRAKTEGVTPSADVVGLVPFGANGNQPTYNLNQGYFGYTAIPATVGKDPERVRELLGILNYLAAPTGSEESLALGGIEGVHYTVAPDGARKRTDLGTTEMGDLTNLTNPPQVLYFPERPEDGPYMQNLIKELLAIGVEDPTLGLYSPTDESKRAELTQLQRDRLASIIQGREPLESWDAFVQDWRSRGGDQIRQEYEQALTGQ